MRRIVISDSKNRELLLLRRVDKYAMIVRDVPVAQWIEHRSPEPVALVRFQSGTL